MKTDKAVISASCMNVSTVNACSVSSVHTARDYGAIGNHYMNAEKIEERGWLSVVGPDRYTYLCSFNPSIFQSFKSRYIAFTPAVMGENTSVENILIITVRRNWVQQRPWVRMY